MHDVIRIQLIMAAIRATPSCMSVIAINNSYVIAQESKYLHAKFNWIRCSSSAGEAYQYHIVHVRMSIHELFWQLILQKKQSFLRIYNISMDVNTKTDVTTKSL